MGSGPVRACVNKFIGFAIYFITPAGGGLSWWLYEFE